MQILTRFPFDVASKYFAWDQRAGQGLVESFSACESNIARVQYVGIYIYIYIYRWLNRFLDPWVRPHTHEQKCPERLKMGPDDVRPYNGLDMSCYSWCFAVLIGSLEVTVFHFFWKSNLLLCFDCCYYFLLSVWANVSAWSIFETCSRSYFASSTIWFRTRNRHFVLWLTTPLWPFGAVRRRTAR